MGTVINEVGSSAGGIAKVEYKDEAGNVLWYYDDVGNFVRNGNVKAGSYSVATLNTPPALPTATGTAGEIRVTAEGIYVANGTNSWVGGTRTYTKTSVFNSGYGVGAFISLTGSPQFGDLTAYDTTDPTKFCIYNLYKSSSNATVQYSLVMNNVLAVSAVNAAGAILLNDTSANIKMSVTTKLISG